MQLMIIKTSTVDFKKKIFVSNLRDETAHVFRRDMEFVIF